MMCGQHVELSEAAEAKVKQLYNQVLNIPGWIIIWICQVHLYDCMYYIDFDVCIMFTVREERDSLL